MDRSAIDSPLELLVEDQCGRGLVLISANVAPLARFSSAMTSAFFAADLRLGCDDCASVGSCASIVLVLIIFSRTGRGSLQIHHFGSERLARRDLKSASVHLLFPVTVM
jgi:hypothetical protein